MKQWYEQLFENYANGYEQEPYIKGTKGETDFIEEELNFDKSKSVLDIGCGTGRHSIELSKRGYDVTGIDFSAAQLIKARQNSIKENVSINFVRTDARYLYLKKRFDLVIMVCEGAFPLMETDEMNYSILKNAASALSLNGKMIFTTLNGLFPLFHSVRDFINKHYENDISKINSFDLMTFRDYSEFEFTDDSGNKKILHCNERYYVPSEITWLLKSLGFSKIKILGAESGNWKRNKELTTGDFEMLVVAGF